MNATVQKMLKEIALNGNREEKFSLNNIAKRYKKSPAVVSKFAQKLRKAGYRIPKGKRQTEFDLFIKNNPAK